MGNYFYNSNEKPLKFKYSDGKFSTPNTVIIHPDFTPVFAFYVAPNDTYLIFSGIHKDGFGGLDIYICFKAEDHAWGTPINMGDKIIPNAVQNAPLLHFILKATLN